jgi:hypothetical protein
MCRSALDEGFIIGGNWTSTLDNTTNQRRAKLAGAVDNVVDAGCANLAAKIQMSRRKPCRLRLVQAAAIEEDCGMGRRTTIMVPRP